MKECKDCIHYEVCKEMFKTVTIKLVGIPKVPKVDPKNCKHYTTKYNTSEYKKVMDAILGEDEK